MIAGQFIYLLIVIGIPFLYSYVCKKWKFFDFLGVTICSFLTGMLVGNILPLEWIPEDLVKEANNIIVCIGIILVLFVTDLKKWFKLSFKVLFAYLLGVTGVLVLAVALFFAFGSYAPLHYVSAMLTGSYVGGTPNMAAIQVAFGIPDELYTSVFLCDVLASSVYLLFIMVFAQRLLGWVLKKYVPAEAPSSEEDVPARLQQKNSTLIFQVLSGIVLSLLVFAVPVVIWVMVTGSMQNMSMIFVILTITLLAVGLSFMPVIRNNPWNYRTGDYLFCLFFTLLGSLTRFDQLMEINGTYVLFTFILLFGSVIIHVFLCRLFKIDRDTMIITSAAGIMSPPFIPAIAGAIKNKDLLVPGIAVAIVGLALGNVSGIFIGELLSRFLK